jgi:sec-independent protein translocase protein TatB
VFDIGLGEMFTLGVVALLIFGPERLPEVAVKAAHFVRKMRGAAASARSDLSTSFGADLDELRDLDPRTFVRRHVLDPADEDGTLRDLRAEARGAGAAASARKRKAAKAARAAKATGGAVPTSSAPGGAAAADHVVVGPGVAVPGAVGPGAVGPGAVGPGAVGPAGVGSVPAGAATVEADGVSPALPPAMRPALLAAGELPPFDDEAT